MEGVIFDLDGTLLDSMGLWRRAGVIYLERYGIEVDESLADIILPLTIRGAARYIKEHFPVPESVENITAGVNGVMEEFYKNGFLEIENTLLPNEFVVLKDETNPKRSALGWKRGARIEAIPHELSDKVWNVSPRSKEQRMALTILMEPSIQIVTLVGQAGSGKTLLALAAALETTIQQNLYDRILVSRPIIPMGNDLGYLPGTKDEKLDVWMQPIYDNLDYLLRSDKNDSQVVRRQIEELKRNHKLELEALTYIRGRSIPRQFVIVDEAQNLTPHEVKTIVSRAGEGTKMILTGDPYQIDNVYLDSCSNGLSFIVDRFKSLPIHGHITLRKSERSPLAAAAAELL